MLKLRKDPYDLAIVNGFIEWIIIIWENFSLTNVKGGSEWKTQKMLKKTVHVREWKAQKMLKKTVHVLQVNKYQKYLLLWSLSANAAIQNMITRQSTN